MPQPLYFPDMVPCDLILFLTLRTMKGRRLATIDKISSELLKESNDIPKSEFQKIGKTMTEVTVSQVENMEYINVN